LQWFSKNGSAKTVQQKRFSKNGSTKAVKTKKRRNKMKKIIVVVLVIAIAMIGASAAMASNISATKHNLSSASAFTASRGTLAEICIYCHTPHGGNQTTAPLWNRTNPVTTSFTVYASGTMTQVMGQPAGISKACLSCHDGASSINVLLNVNSAPYTGTSKLLTGIANLGTSLVNDHPIGVSVTASGDPDIKAPTLTGIRVFSNLVECASCHDVHDNANGMFLAASNSGSAICLACHIK